MTPDTVIEEVFDISCVAVPTRSQVPSRQRERLERTRTSIDATNCSTSSKPQEHHRKKALLSDPPALELPCQQVAQPTFDEWHHTPQEEDPNTPPRCPETAPGALSDRPRVESVVDQVLQILSATYKSQHIKLSNWIRAANSPTTSSKLRKPRHVSPSQARVYYAEDAASDTTTLVSRSDVPLHGISESPNTTM